MNDVVQNYAIERLSLLIYAGYEVQSPAFPSDSVLLKHPSRKERFRTAHLYSDGLVVFPLGVREERRFFSDANQEEFEEFVRGISGPTWWQRKAEIDGLAYFYLLLLIVLLFAWKLS